MTNNKQQTAVKLYTEEQVKEIYFKGVHNGRLHIEGKCSDEVELLTPIELPSDEELKKVLIQYKNNKQSIFNRILNWFKLKCPDCKSSLYQEERSWFNKINIYHCTKCKKQWI